MGPYVSQIEEEAPADSESKVGRAATAGPREVRKVRSQGLSTAAKIALLFGIGAGVVALIIGYKVSHPLSDVKFDGL